MAEPDAHHRWFCNHCNVSIRIHNSGTTLNIKRHLKKAHGINISRTESQDEEEDEEEKEQQLNLLLLTLYLNKVDAERFRILLLRWLL